MKQLEASLPGPACTCTTSCILHHEQYREGMPEFFGIALGIITYYMIPFPNSFSDDFVA